MTPTDIATLAYWALAVLTVAGGIILLCGIVLLALLVRELVRGR